MAEFPALPLFTDAYLADTRHLTAAQHGAYLLLLMMAWRMPDCMLPDDDTKLARWAAMDPRTWRANRDVILEFWQRTDEGFLRQRRLSDEREFVEAKRNKNAAAGRASALKRQHRGSTNVEPEANETSTPTPTPTPTVREEQKCSSRRGSRLPDDWTPDEVFAASEGMLAEECQREAQKFRDYWRQQSGQKGVKADWPAVWRNWVRRAADDKRARAPKRNDDDHAYRGVL